VILDLHTHSIKSDDGRAKVQNYCQWIRSRELPLDGFVLTEHRQFDLESDYSELAKSSGLTILKGAEVETEYGHVLVFGVTEALTAAFDFADIRLPLARVLEQSAGHGAVANGWYFRDLAETWLWRQSNHLVQARELPDDLVAALDANSSARTVWNRFPPSTRKSMLWWVISAGRDDTRARRIETIVEKAARLPEQRNRPIYTDR